MAGLLKSYKIELCFTGLAMGCFVAYLIYGFNSYRIPATPLMDGLIFTSLLMVVLIHYFFILAKVAVISPPESYKWWHFVAVLLTGHFGAWFYSLFINKKRLDNGRLPNSRGGSKGKIIRAEVLQKDTEKSKASGI